MIAEIRLALGGLKDDAQAEVLQRFFKTGPGQYGHGDRFLGIRVPALRKLAGQYQGLPMDETVELLESPLHEERLLALLIWVKAYQGGDGHEKEEIYRLYLGNTRFINNWDLVDLSAPQIVGAHLLGRSRKPLHLLARSDSLWERRIAVIASFHFIKQKQFDETLTLAGILLEDREDLIHKAVGWMLREIGKRNMSQEEGFLKEHYPRMPRTMLRYAIERFPEELRQAYLKGSI